MPLYLANLVIFFLSFRLSRLQNRKGGMVGGLRERREDEMRRFLEDKDRVFSGIQNEDDSSATIPDNPILRRLAPERQALTEEEKVALVKADALQKDKEEGEGKEQVDDDVEKKEESEKQN